MRVSWSPTAERNLDAIWEYIAQDNLDAADKMAVRLRSAAGVSSEHPNMGTPGRARQTRELVVAGTAYILVYRPSRSMIDIIRVIHGAQD
jgi:addiction module RelE/StbE family toxin